MYGMTTGHEMTPEQYADGERDALAIAAAFVVKTWKLSISSVATLTPTPSSPLC